VANQKARPKYLKSRHYRGEEKAEKDAKKQKKLWKSIIKAKKNNE
jgi:hypothetical protein